MRRKFYDNLVGYDLEITTVEVKLSLKLESILQAFAHTRFSNFSYLVVGGKKEELDDKLVDYCHELGIGLARIGKRHGLTCETIHPSRHFSPRMGEVDRVVGALWDKPWKLKQEFLQRLTESAS